MKQIPIRSISTVQEKPPTSERFKIRTVQAILAGNILKQELHRHDFFFTLLLENANGSHGVDFTPYQVINNSIFFLRPGQVHQLILNADCTCYSMEFNNEFYHPKDKFSSQCLRKASNKNYCKLGVKRFER